MAVLLRNKQTQKNSTVKYNQWINDIVLKGKTHKYKVIKTWELVMLRKKIDGVFKNLEITEIENAKNLKQKSPLQYDYVGIDVDAQIKKDIAKSNTINRWRFFFWVRNTAIEITRPIRNPIKHISLAEWILIILGLLTILIMTEIIDINL